MKYNKNLRDYLESQKESLDQAFDYLLSNADLLKSINRLKASVINTKLRGGKVIFTGVGKNVFACQKLAASFSSIGIPSFFLDAVHAVHGDLGILSSNDLLIAISKSGNTQELINTLNHIKSNTHYENFNFDMWGIDCNTTKENSFDKLCNEVIHLNIPHEIDHLNLVPTVSAVFLQMIGDIVGVAAGEELGFDAEIFSMNHPGGTIGKSLSK